jgi:hypothetical protein
VPAGVQQRRQPSAQPHISGHMPPGSVAGQVNAVVRPRLRCASRLPEQRPLAAACSWRLLPAPGVGRCSPLEGTAAVAQHVRIVRMHPAGGCAGGRRRAAITRPLRLLRLAARPGRGGRGAGALGWRLQLGGRWAAVAVAVTVRRRHQVKIRGSLALHLGGRSTPTRATCCCRCGSGCPRHRLLRLPLRLPQRLWLSLAGGALPQALRQRCRL